MYSLLILLRSPRHIPLIIALVKDLLRHLGRYVFANLCFFDSPQLFRHLFDYVDDGAFVVFDSLEAPLNRRQDAIIVIEFGVNFRLL